MSDLKELKELKTREEFVKYFKGQHFEFEFYLEGMVYFKSLSPINVDGNLFKFELSLFTHEKEFFRFSSFENWFERMQIADIRIIAEGNSSQHVELYSEKYNENFEN
jgi:hypothetical protein